MPALQAPTARRTAAPELAPKPLSFNAPAPQTTEEAPIPAMDLWTLRFWLLCAGAVMTFAVCYHWLNRLLLK